MKSRSILSPIAAITVLGCLVVAVGYDTRKTLADSQFPQSGWVAGFHAYQGAGYESAPVQVVGVKSRIEEGLTSAFVRNRSDKTVKAIKFGWYVSESKTAGAILAKGETALVNLELASNQKSEVITPRLSWEDVLKPAMRKGPLDGDYDIWTVVKKVIYADGSEWTFAEPTNLARDSKRNAH